MYNILVTGSNGQLGSDIKSLSLDSDLELGDCNFYFASRDMLDITSYDDIELFVSSKNINVIINCAAYTAVDKAEQENQNADMINHQAVKYMATIAKNKSIRLIHISSDYVFDGTSCTPYKEDDATNPQSVYGMTKLDGELAMIKINPENSCIIRTSWVYSSYGNNFVKTMRRLGEQKESLGVIYDQIGTPTYARDLAKMILGVLIKFSSTDTEVFHYSNEGVCSWYDFAKKIMSISKIDCQINPIETKEYPTPASRPSYSLLNKSKIKKTLNIEIPYWKDSLKSCIKRLS